MKQAKIRRWGNSLAVRIPATLVRKLGLREGNTVILDRERKNIVIKHVTKQASSNTKAWKAFLVPTRGKKRQAVSRNIDRILYDSHR